MGKAYEKISSTAKFVAYLRTFSDIPFATEIASESGAKEAFEALAGGSKKSVVKMSPYWEARYKTTNRILVQKDLTQVLEVAAGLSPRGLVMTENPEVVYVSTDLPQILEEEKSIVEAILLKGNDRRPNLHFEVANALDRGSLLRVAAAFEKNRPIAVLTEGLFPYFDREEQSALASNVHDVLDQYNGIWVATDVRTKRYFEAAIRLDETGQKRRETIASSTGSDFERNLFADENDVRCFFGTAGFQMEEFPYSDPDDPLSSVKQLGLSQEETESALELINLSKTLVLTPRRRNR